VADRIGAERVLRSSFVATLAPAVALAVSYKQIVPLTIGCLTVAIALGLGTGAVFKLVAAWYPSDVGAVTGVVGAAGGLGGFFPPLVMALVKGLIGSYTLGFFLFAGVAVLCLFVLTTVDRSKPRAGAPRSALAPCGLTTSD